MGKEIELQTCMLYVMQFKFIVQGVKRVLVALKLTDAKLTTFNR